MAKAQSRTQEEVLASAVEVEDNDGKLLEAMYHRNEQRSLHGAVRGLGFGFDWIITHCHDGKMSVCMLYERMYAL